jgi:hypothetical protein
MNFTSRKIRQKRDGGQGTLFPIKIIANKNGFLGKKEELKESRGQERWWPNKMEAS